MSVNSEGQYWFSELDVYGASILTPMAGGIFKFEFGHYYSKQDSEGTNPSIPNSENRYLTGFEHEIIKNMTGSVQLYAEQTLDYDQYKKAASGRLKKEVRKMITSKVRYSILKQTLSFTGMLFFSPTDSDGHLRINIDYQYSDDTKFGVGSNLFHGKYQDTFWGQFEDTSNVFAFIKMSF